MDRTGEKRKRSSNFQLSETRLLVDTVLPFKDIIENKANDSFNIKEKNHTWEKIAALFNAVGCAEVQRNPKVLKLKYEGIKKLLRRKLAEHKREMYVSGRESMSSIKMEDYEEKMFSIVLCNVEDTSRYENNELKFDRKGHLEKNISDGYDLSNASTFDGEDTEVMEYNGQQICSPEIQEITIKKEIESSNIELVVDNSNTLNEAAVLEPSLSINENVDDFVPRTISIDNPKNLKWKQFNTRKPKVRKPSLQFQLSRTESINKLKFQDNEIAKQELEIEHLKTEHELRKKILEKELEEKEAILKRNDEEYRLKMRLMEIQLKHRELELLSKMNT